jgi:predicted membrane protein (TIGR00267 family)
VVNSFDGILIVLGVLFGSRAAGVVQASAIIRITIAGAMAMFISGFFGCYFTEKAEREREIKELERAMLKKLDKSVIHDASTRVPILIALADGLSPLVSAIIVILPFFFSSIIGVTCAFYTSIALAVALLFFLGCFLGKLSRTRVLVNGLRMVLVAVLAIVLMLLLGLV